MIAENLAIDKKIVDSIFNELPIVISEKINAGERAIIPKVTSIHSKPVKRKMYVDGDPNKSEVKPFLSLRFQPLVYLRKNCTKILTEEEYVKLTKK